MTFEHQGYQSAYPYDYARWNDYGNVMLLQEDRLHMVVNAPNEKLVTEFWMVLEDDDPTTVSHAFKKEFSLQTYESQT